MFPEMVFKKNDPTFFDQEKTVLIVPERIYGEEKKFVINSFVKAGLKVTQQIEAVLTKSDLKYLYKDIIVKRDLMDDRVEEMYGSNLFIIVLEGKVMR